MMVNNVPKYQQNEQLPQTTVPQKTTPYDVTSDPGLEHAQKVAEYT